MCYVCVYDCVCDMCEQDTQSAALIAQLAEEEKAEREERKLRQELQDVYEIKSMLRIRESQGNFNRNHGDQSVCVLYSLRSRPLHLLQLRWHCMLWSPAG